MGGSLLQSATWIFLCLGRWHCQLPSQFKSRAGRWSQLLRPEPRCLPHTWQHLVFPGPTTICTCREHRLALLCKSLCKRLMKSGIIVNISIISMTKWEGYHLMLSDKSNLKEAFIPELLMLRDQS